MEEKLRDFLQDPLKGDKSPLKLIVNYEILKYIQEHSTDPGVRYYIELELDDSIILYPNYVVLPKFRIGGYEDYSGRYKTKLEQKQECGYKTYITDEFLFITNDDFEKSSSKTPNKNIQLDLYYNVLKDHNLTEYDIRLRREAIYDQTYKLDLLTYRRSLSELSQEEIKHEYYRYYIPAEFEKLRYELEKYFENNLRSKYKEIIGFYIKNFTLLVNEQNDQYLKKCYGIIYFELVRLNEHLKHYFNIKLNHPGSFEKLEWTGIVEEFLDFFEPLINNGLCRCLKYVDQKNG